MAFSTIEKKPSNSNHSLFQVDHATAVVLRKVLGVVVDIVLESSQIDVAKAAHHRRRPHRAVILAPLYERNACARRDIAVARGVDDDFSHNRLAPGFIVDDDALDLIIADQRLRNPGVQ